MIGKAVYDLLRYDAAVYAVVGTKIYPGYADPKATYPLITYDIVSNVPTYAKGTTGLVEGTRVQINCIAHTYAAVADLAAKVRTAIDGFTGIPTAGAPDIITAIFDGWNDLAYEEDVYGRALDFIMKVRK